MTAKTAKSIDLMARMATLSASAEEAAVDRVGPNTKWGIARRVTESQPSAVSVPSPSQASALAGATSTSSAGTQFNVENLAVGQIYSVPVHLIDPNPLGARYFYRAENIETVGKTMKEGGQDVPANGYVSGDRVVLYDGGTRLRSATQFGISVVQVKIETPPADRKELYKRSARLNDQRSDHTALDVAVAMARLLKEGVYATQEEIAADIPDRKGNPLSKQQVSMYLRIAKIPEAFLAKMSYHDQTSTFTIAYEVSSLFVAADYEASKDRYDEIAMEVIEEIQRLQLSKSQAQTLIRSKLQGKQSRLRADSTTVKYGDAKGTMKLFPSRGQLDFSISGLDQTQLEFLRQSIEKVCSGQMPLSP